MSEEWGVCACTALCLCIFWSPCSECVGVFDAVSFLRYCVCVWYSVMSEERGVCACTALCVCVCAVLSVEWSLWVRTLWWVKCVSVCVSVCVCLIVCLIVCVLGMHRYHFFTNRYEYEYFYSCTCRYRVPIPILFRFDRHESAINLEADFILSSADYVKPIVQN